MSDADYAEGVRRSAEFMRLHEDEPNEYRPANYECARCGTAFSEEETHAKCADDCGNRLCEACAPKKVCESCAMDRAEAVEIEAARLEAEIEANKESLLRVMNQ